MSTSTKYQVFVNDEAVEGTFSKKAKGVEAVEKAAKADVRANVQLRTEAGTVVHEVKGRKTINMSKPYTRLVELPEGFVIPEGLRPAYTRARKNLVILHDPEAESGAYSVVNFVTGETLASELDTTRDSGAFCKTVPAPAKETANA